MHGVEEGWRERYGPRLAEAGLKDIKDCVGLSQDELTKKLKMGIGT